jgi:hypothetical protein
MIRFNSPIAFTKLAIIIALTASMILVGAALAQTNTTAPWAAFTSGGGQSASQDFGVTSIIGQPIVGHSSSETFQLDAGLLGDTGFTIVCVYDENSDGVIDRSEALKAVTGYLLGLSNITRVEAIDVVTAYLLVTNFDC